MTVELDTLPSWIFVGVSTTSASSLETSERRPSEPIKAYSNP